MATPEERTASFEREALPHLDLLYRVARRLTGDPTRAEDLVQDTMLKAFRAWDRFEAGTNARGWLLTILRNTFINDYRRARRTPVTVDLELAEPHRIFQTVAESDPEGEFFRRVVDERVVAAIDGLPDEFREVLVLSDVEGLPYAEIAAMLNLPLGTVKSRLFRARRQLQAELYDHAVEAGIVRPREPTP
jgi:RNA polymerase sigma-70 factor, ECF subfamily